MADKSVFREAMDEAIDTIVTTIGSNFSAANSATGETQEISVVIDKEVEIHDNLVFVGSEIQATVSANSKLKLGDTIEDLETCEIYELTRFVSETKSKLVFALTER